MTRFGALSLALVLIPVAVPLAAQSTHDELVALFREWREFEKPEFVDGVPDYTAPAMAEKLKKLPSWK